MDTAQKVPIIKEIDDVILGGSWKAVFHALSLSLEGRRVLLATSATFLGEDICASGRYLKTELPKELLTYLPEHIFVGACLHPDRFKRFLEEEVSRAGVALLYFVHPIDATRSEGGSILLRLGGKSGISGLICSRIWKSEKPAPSKEERRYRAFVRREHFTSAHVELFESVRKGKAQKESLAKLLTEDKKNLMDAFVSAKKKEPELMLGRFALRELAGESTAPVLCEPEEINRVAKDRPSKEVRADNPLMKEGRYPFQDMDSLIKGESLSYDLIVVGGGTAGAMAALYGARGGLRTVLVEPCYMLGGTATAGGVSTYWFGRRFLPVREIDAACATWMKLLGGAKRKGIWSENDDFHPGVRDYVLSKLCLAAGVEILFGQMAYGVLMDKQRVAGVATIGDEGSLFLSGNTVFDATGDGDVAVFAGAKAEFGSKRDGITYWGSLAQFTSCDSYQNNFSSMVCSGDAVDYTRFILLGRKRGEATFDHGTYVSMRESRHICGLKRITLREMITCQTYEDGIYTCYSNYDPKGRADADLIYCGMLPPQQAVQIPLSALIPIDACDRQVTGMYVLGKAISASHNCIPSIRMQPDLMQQGAVMGLLLAKAEKQGISIEQLPKEECRALILQTTGDELKLPKNEKSLSELVWEIDAATRTHWVDAAFAYEETACNPWMVLYGANKGAAVPALLKRCRLETDPKLRTAFFSALLFHGCEVGVNSLLETVMEQLLEGLPRREASSMCVQLLPDHGVMPETVYLLNTLAHSQSETIVKAYERVLELLQNKERDYEDIGAGIFHYVEASAYAAERNGSCGFIPILKELLRLPELKPGAFEKEALLAERMSILRLVLLRALARLGELEGYLGLVLLLKEESVTLAFGAKKELCMLLQTDKGFQEKEWCYEIKNNEKAAKVQRIKEHLW